MRIIFMGTPDFAVPSLRTLVEDGYTVPLVVTQADKPKGRGHREQPTPVKKFALSNGLEVFQPATLKDAEVQEKLASYEPDLIVVTAYGKILPEAVLRLPRYGCINVHASLLPRYRGAAPVQRAVLNGETTVGVTTMQMDVGLDTGDILMQSSRPLPPEMTAGELLAVLSEDGAKLLSDTLRALQEGTLSPRKQEDELSTYAAMLDKSLCPMDWTKTAEELRCQVHGLNPWPSANTVLEGITLKVHRARVGDSTDLPAGKVVKGKSLRVACGDGLTLELLEVQGEGGKRMSGEAFLCGHPMG